VIGNDCWESVATDIVGIHDYDADADRLARRYHADLEIPRIFTRERPGGRLLVLEADRHMELPIISEFGGIALARVAGAWGYSKADGEEDLAQRYERLRAAVRSLGILSGFCYTQFAGRTRRPTVCSIPTAGRRFRSRASRRRRGGLPSRSLTYPPSAPRHPGCGPRATISSRSREGVLVQYARRPERRHKGPRRLMSANEIRGIRAISEIRTETCNEQTARTRR
jgi:hypothetical protein